MDCIRVITTMICAHVRPRPILNEYSCGVPNSITVNQVYIDGLLDGKTVLGIYIQLLLLR
jgi:hypothetical protein